jgi:hypothetical protein
MGREFEKHPAQIKATEMTSIFETLRITGAEIYVLRLEQAS